jgi:hypothetical protein
MLCWACWGLVGQCVAGYGFALLCCDEVGSRQFMLEVLTLTANSAGRKQLPWSARLNKQDQPRHQHHRCRGG